MKQYNSMTAHKRFDGTINVHVPSGVKAGIVRWAEQHDQTRSEAIRDLLVEGLRAKGIA